MSVCAHNLCIEFQHHHRRHRVIIAEFTVARHWCLAIEFFFFFFEYLLSLSSLPHIYYTFITTYTHTRSHKQYGRIECVFMIWFSAAISIRQKKGDGNITKLLFAHGRSIYLFLSLLLCSQSGRISFTNDNDDFHIHGFYVLCHAFSKSSIFQRGRGRDPVHKLLLNFIHKHIRFRLWPMKEHKTKTYVSMYEPSVRTTNAWHFMIFDDFYYYHYFDSGHNLTFE